MDRSDAVKRVWRSGAILGQIWGISGGQSGKIPPKEDGDRHHDDGIDVDHPDP